MPEENWEEVKGGYEVIRRGGEIVALRNSTVRKIVVRVGDEVIANGRFGAPEGTNGIVMSLQEPFTNGLTYDVIGVAWMGRGTVQDMKLKDLDLQKLLEAFQA